MPRSKEPILVDQLDPLPVRLPTASLQQTWERELHSIGENLKVMVILHHVTGALGFARGLHAAELISAEQHRAMTDAVHRAERAAYQRLADGEQ